MSLLDTLFGEYDGDLAIDLGTANTLVAARGQGIVLNEPSVVAIDKSEDRVLAVGADAKRMIGRTPGSIIAERPLKDGVIADFDVTEVMLRYFIEKARGSRRYPWSPRPRVVVCVPSGVTSVEKRAVFEATISAGARQAYLIEEPMAAAIGADLPIEDPTGSMVVDIGGGTTEVAVIAMGGIVVSQSIRTAGDEFDQTILEHVREAYNLSIGERTAEDIKIRIGCCYPRVEDDFMEVRGRNLVTGLPRIIKVSTGETEEALKEPCNQIVEAVHSVLEKTPPELAADIADRGIVLTGGGSLLQGLEELITSKTGINTVTAEDPMTAVAIGTGRYVEFLSGQGFTEP